MKTPADIRTQLVEALRLDLVGPDPHDEAHASEVLPTAPSTWYLTGFLVPFEAAVPDEDGELRLGVRRADKGSKAAALLRVLRERMQVVPGLKVRTWPRRPSYATSRPACSWRTQPSPGRSSGSSIA